MREPHESLQGSTYFSDFHFENRNEYEYKMDELFGSYPFLIEEEYYDHEFPFEPKERYQSFKDSTCQFYYERNLLNYRNLLVRENDNELKAGYLFELEKVIFNHRITGTEKEKKILNYQAQQFFLDTYIDSVSDSQAKYTPEDITLYLFVLHQNGYFDHLPIPEQAFSVEFPPEKYYAIGEVFAKYIMFYDFLKKEIETISKSDTQSINNKASPSESHSIRLPKMKDLPIGKLQDMFLPEHSGKYKVLIDFLVKENPYAELKSLSRKKSKPLSQTMLHSFKGFDKPFFYLENGDADNVNLNRSYVAEKTIAASLLLQLKSYNFISNVGISRLYEISNNTFNTGFNTHNLFSSLSKKGTSDLHMEFFEMVLERLFT